LDSHAARLEDLAMSRRNRAPNLIWMASGIFGNAEFLGEQPFDLDPFSSLGR
jgi:hypothetical protein